MSALEQAPDADTQNQPVVDAEPQQTGNLDQPSDPAQSGDVQNTEQTDQDDPAIINIVAQAGGDPVKLAKRIQEKDRVISKLSETPAKTDEEVQAPTSIVDILAQGGGAAAEAPVEEHALDALDPNFDQSVNARIDQRVNERMDAALKAQDEKTRLTLQEQEIVNDPVLGKAVTDGHYAAFLKEVGSGQLNTMKNHFQTWLFGKGLHPSMSQLRNNLRNNNVPTDNAASISEGANASEPPVPSKYGPDTQTYLDQEGELPPENLMPRTQ